MPNTCDYTIVLREPVEDREEVVRRVLLQVATLGYSPAGECWVLDAEGEEHLFTSRDDVLGFLAAHGGLTTLWPGKGDELFVSFDWEGSSISLGVLHPLLLSEDGHQLSAADLEALFTLLCREIEPAFGYASDEWTLEGALGAHGFLANWHAFEQALREQRAPPLLFRLNYFAKDYFERIGEERLSTVSHRVVPLGDGGLLVDLCAPLCEGQVALLDDEGRHYRSCYTLG